MTLAWHTNIASRWLDPQQHDGTASPDNFLFALHDGLIKNFREQKYDHLALADQFDFPEDAQSATFRLRQGSNSTTGRRSRPKTSNGATRTIAARRPSCCTRRPRTSSWSTTARSGSSSPSRFLIFRSCSAPAICAAPAGSCRGNTIRKSARTVFCRSRSAPARTRWFRRNPARGSCSRRSRITTGRSTSSTSR